MPADEVYDDPTWVPGNPVLRGAGRKETAPGFTPAHRVRADELPHSQRAALGLTGPDPDPIVYADEPVPDPDPDAPARFGAPSRPGLLPGVPFLPARKENFGAGRQGYGDIWFVLHCTDDNYADTYPENLGRYWGREVTQVSVHFCVSDTMIRQFVNMNDAAFQARNPANLRGVGVELSGLSSWSREQWLAHRPMIRRAAQLCLDVSKVRGYGNPTGHLLTGNDLRARGGGATQHRDLTVTFGGTHTDLGQNFPWDVFAADLKALQTTPPPSPAPVVKPPAPKPAPAPQEGSMTTLTGAMIDRWKGQLDAIDDTVRGGKGSAYQGSVLQRDLRQVVATVTGQISATNELIRQLLTQAGGAAATVDLAAVERAACDGARRALDEFSAAPQ